MHFYWKLNKFVDVLQLLRFQTRELFAAYLLTYLLTNTNADKTCIFHFLHVTQLDKVT